jgi:hypothetical protein
MIVRIGGNARQDILFPLIRNALHHSAIGYDNKLPGLLVANIRGKGAFLYQFLNEVYRNGFFPVFSPIDSSFSRSAAVSHGDLFEIIQVCPVRLRKLHAVVEFGQHSFVKVGAITNGLSALEDVTGEGQTGLDPTLPAVGLGQFLENCHCVIDFHVSPPLDQL